MGTTKKGLESLKIGTAKMSNEIPDNRSMEEKISSILILVLLSRKQILNLLSEMLRKRATDSTKEKRLESPLTYHSSRNMDLEFLSSLSFSGPSSRLSSLWV